jgi:hypothetical protein
LIGVLLSFASLVLDHTDKASQFLSIIWNYLFVNIWYLWVVAAGYGLYRFVRLIQDLHNNTTKILTADAENKVHTQKLVEKESASRVAATDDLSKRINALDTGFKKDLDREVGALHAKLDELIRKEAHERADGINAINRRIEFERMNKIETSLPNQIIGRIQEIEKKLTAQISALNKRVEKVESPSGLNLETANRMGIINSTPPAIAPHEVIVPPKGRGLINYAPHDPTPKEAVVNALLEQKKKQP